MDRPALARAHLPQHTVGQGAQGRASPSDVSRTKHLLHARLSFRQTRVYTLTQTILTRCVVREQERNGVELQQQLPAHVARRQVLQQAGQEQHASSSAGEGEAADQSSLKLRTHICLQFGRRVAGMPLPLFSRNKLEK